jgi:WD40 repeat protein
MLPNKDTGQLYPHLTVYSCAEDNRIMAWDAHTLSCIGSMQLDQAHHHSQSLSASLETLLSPPPRPGEIQPFVTCQGLDGVLYVGHRGGAVEQWDLESKTLLRANAGHTASVRALAILHKVPYAHSLVLSGADDGTIRVWKSSTLLAAEQEGIRLESERKTQEEALAKRRAKEALEQERQRIKNLIAQQKAAVRSVLFCPLCPTLLARAG